MTKILYLLDNLRVGGAEKSLLEVVRCFKSYEELYERVLPEWRTSR
jgi:hypothetical protein